MVTTHAGSSRANVWAQAVEKSPFIEYLDVCLRGSGQVIFMDNPLTGLLNFVAIFWGAIAAGTPEVAIGALIATLVSTAMAYSISVDRSKLKMGLYGFNGMLVGCGIPTFLGATPLMWVILVIGAMVSTVVMLAIANVMETWKAPAFTFPFVLTTWLIMLSAYAFPHLTIAGLPHAALAHTTPTPPQDLLDLPAYMRASLVSVAQVWFINNPVSGVIFLLALLVESAWAAGLALVGAMIAVGCAMVGGVNLMAISNGLWGFSAVLTAVAVGCVFMKPCIGTLLYALLATVFTVIVQAALNVGLGPMGIPTFTFPFVLTSWLFVLAQRNFEPQTGKADSPVGAA
jgi:urea transporter